MEDRELPRVGQILERMAYEDDVRKVVKRIIVNNDYDKRAELIYLQSQKREHSQKVHDRGQQQGKKGNARFESADNRNKHVAIVNEQIK